MKLQKLVYFAQGFYGALNSGATLFPEEFEAWKYGPVIPSLYHMFKIYFAGPIPESHPFQAVMDLTETEREVVQWVFENLGGFSAVRLSDISHQPGSPWDKVYSGTLAERFIPVATMTEYFKKFVKEKDTVPA